MCHDAPKLLVRYSQLFGEDKPDSHQHNFLNRVDHVEHPQKHTHVYRISSGSRSSTGHAGLGFGDALSAVETRVWDTVW